MNCPNCGGSKFMVEGIGNNQSRGFCTDCRYSNIIDNKGREYLTDEKFKHVRRGRFLTEVK